MGQHHWHRVWDTSCPGCLLLDLLGTQVSRACMQVLLPDILGLRCVFLAAGPQRGKLLISAIPVASVSSISHGQIDTQIGCRVGECWRWGIQVFLGGNHPQKRVSQLQPG